MVIITTRNEGVASLVGNFLPYYLFRLSDDICLSVFLCHALGATSFEAHQNLTDIGTEIVKRCKGLPLAAKMLGGMLRGRHKPEQWQDVLESEIWDLSESGILPVLKLSYHHLPSHLKRCFAYCSLFPADYEFGKQDLTLLWMAEGFLQSRSNQKKQMEELGTDYFDNLTSRSFFQPSSTSSCKFVMHDLIHDLARHVASDAYLHVDNQNTAMSHDTTLRVRYSSFVRGKYDTFKRLEALGDLSSLRTFLALPIQKRGRQSYLSRKVLFDLLKLKRMRVLSLCGYQIKEIPDSVAQLKHLRYLNMTGAQIEKLPESVTSLFNLLTLMLSGCTNLRELPSSIGNLVNLRYLDLDDTRKLLRMPGGIKNLKSLQKLSKFVVEKNELEISDLKNFSSVGGNLLITGLHNIVDISSAIHASLNDKDGLEKLRMEWRNEFDDSRDEEIEGQVLHHLQTPKSLQELEIFYYGGKRLPCWMGDPLYAPNIVRLRIDGCKNVTALPPLGRLPLLKELTLSLLIKVISVGDELYGYDDPLFVGKAFPSLETLSISHMWGWEEWSCSSHLPSLRVLEIVNCPKLMGKLPSHLPSLKKLKIQYCPQLTGKLSSHLPFIEKLQILDCPQLTTAPIATSIASVSDLDLEECVIDKDSVQVHLNSLTKLRIANISDLCSLNMLNSLSCLHELTIESCPRLVSFGEISLPSTLKSLNLSYCEALETWPLMHAKCFLEKLLIQGCNSLECFPVVKEAKSSELVCWRVKILSISNNKKLSQDIVVHNIESLNIMKCPSLTCFPARDKKLPCSLKSLFISKCEKLQTLTEGMLMQDNNVPLPLEIIYITGCPSLTCFPAIGRLPTSLKQLTIQDCPELESIPGTSPGSSLEKVYISSCQNLEELPGSIMQYNVPNLKEVRVSHCENLRSLPNQMNILTSLVELDIDGCPAVRWSSNPQGGGLGVPLNITKLNIGKTLLHMRKWRLDCLTSLQSLHIDGRGMDDVISFPEYDHGKSFFLPTSLTDLKIYNFKNLESLSNGLQKLSFLKRLEIFFCPKLRYLPSEGLSSTLEFLFIFPSAIMRERCKKDGGDYWPIILHIPCVIIDGEFH